MAICEWRIQQPLPHCVSYIPTSYLRSAEQIQGTMDHNLNHGAPKQQHDILLWRADIADTIGLTLLTLFVMN